MMKTILKNQKPSPMLTLTLPLPTRRPATEIKRERRKKNNHSIHPVLSFIHHVTLYRIENFPREQKDP